MVKINNIARIAEENSFEFLNLAEAGVVANKTQTETVEAKYDFAEAMYSLIKDANEPFKEIAMEVQTADGFYYYSAKIKAGTSYESGNLEFEVTTISKAAYDDKTNNLTAGTAKMTYDARPKKNDFTIYMKDADGNVVTFSQGKLDADTLDHIWQGTQAKMGGTYDMTGEMHEGSNKWKIQFGTDSNYNVEYMKMQKQK